MSIPASAVYVENNILMITPAASNPLQPQQQQRNQSDENKQMSRQQAEQREVLLAALDVRIRDVQQGPDGNLYIATERSTAGAVPDGAVMRIEPEP